MRSPKMLLAVAGPALALLAIGAPAASASSWYVAGHELKKGENAPLASTAALDSPFLLSAPSISLKISCTTYKTGKTELLGGFELTDVESDQYEGCSVLSPTSCKLQPPPVIGPQPSRNEWYLVAGLLRNEWRLRLVRGNGKTTLATITLEGSGCALAGEDVLSGSFVLAVPTLEEEAASHQLEGLSSTENNSLEFDGAKAYIEGDKQLLRLASGSKWSFHI
jgi:hypothetical protein